jgi:hypothetical protein
MDESLDITGGNDWLGGLQGYTPEKVVDNDFGIIKGTFNCRFNFFKIEDYKGEVTELKGTEVARYELQIIDEGEFLNRRLWKKFYLGSKKPDGKGKLDSQKFADLLFKLGYEFKTREELNAVLELAVENVISVNARSFIGKEEQARVDKGEIKKEDAEQIQMHTIKGQGKSVKEGSSKAAPF